ncbi:MAG TPA: nucleoside hydrolase-like domain-containing protein [Pirellulaceae bacterium]|nr:nucleoside hydrolase-like domain-containing protein [Pirellulaceae bacterium]
MSRILLALAALLTLPGAIQVHAADRLRLIVETDAGGDPDDEQSLVRFLLYTNEWNVEGIIANRPKAREGENKNTERTGLGIVRRQIKAYGECYGKLGQHDQRFPQPEDLLQRAVAGYDDVDDGVKLVIEAVDRDDPRPVWFLNWGTDNGAAESCLKRALDRVLAERGKEGYARFKRKLRLASDDQFDEHTTKLEPPFPLWVDTFRPPRDGKRWYHRFSKLTREADGFDIERDVRTGHGPLGALYPSNTTHRQKEGDSPTFIYLIPTGLSDPEHPTWGGWPGRYGPHDEHPGKPYYWANLEDAWQGKTNRDNTLLRWAAAIQNDFAARMDWCVRDFADANHPPQPKVAGELVRSMKPGERITLDALATTDPDGDPLDFAWFFYPESTGYTGELPKIDGSDASRPSFVAPARPATAKEPAELHLILAVTDRGEPPLTRYARLMLEMNGP